MQHRKKILLVEDDTALAAVYRSRLELEGFEIREVHNGEDALSVTALTCSIFYAIRQKQPTCG